MKNLINKQFGFVCIFLFSLPLLAQSQEIASEPYLCVSGIMDGQLPMAVINADVFELGADINGCQITAITSEKVSFQCGNIIIYRMPGQACAKSKKSVREKYQQQIEKSQQPKDLQAQQYSKHGLELCQKAADHFVQALQYEKLKNNMLAAVHFEKAAQFAKWSLSYVIHEARNDMKAILKEVKKRQELLNSERRKIAASKLPELRTQQEIVIWMKQNIKYQEDKDIYDQNEYWQSPKETIILKTGDCEDTAFLAQEFLKKINEDSRVIAIHYGNRVKGYKGHAICMFPKDDPQFYISNDQLHRMDDGLMGFVEKFYPDWFQLKELYWDSKTSKTLYTQEIGQVKKVGNYR